MARQGAATLADAGAPLAPELFSPEVGAPPLATPANSNSSLRTACDRFEAAFIRQALECHAGRKSETARALGITREGLYKKMKRLGVR